MPEADNPHKKKIRHTSVHISFSSSRDWAGTCLLTHSTVQCPSAVRVSDSFSAPVWYTFETDIAPSKRQAAESARVPSLKDGKKLLLHGSHSFFQTKFDPFLSYPIADMIPIKGKRTDSRIIPTIRESRMISVGSKNDIQ